MNVAERIEAGAESSTGLVAAVGDVEAYVREFSECFLARIANDAAELGRGPQVLAMGRKMIDVLGNLKSKMLAGDYKDDPALDDLSGHLAHWLQKSDEALELMDEVELRYRSSSRESRRANSRKYAMANDVANAVRDIKTLLLDIFELIDPTPENYLDELMGSFHADQPPSMIVSFGTLSSSGNYSAGAVKRRHGLK